MAEAILDQQSAGEQQQVCLPVASQQTYSHTHCDGNSRCSISTSSESKPPLSPSVDGSQASLTPDSSMTFAGKASRDYKLGSEHKPVCAKTLHCAGMRSNCEDCKACGRLMSQFFVLNPWAYQIPVSQVEDLDNMTGQRHPPPAGRSQALPSQSLKAGVRIQAGNPGRGLCLHSAE